MENTGSYDLAEDIGESYSVHPHRRDFSGRGSVGMALLHRHWYRGRTCGREDFLESMQLIPYGWN